MVINAATRAGPGVHIRMPGSVLDSRAGSILASAEVLLFWDRFSVGMAPMVIGIFFFSSTQLISVGNLEEYIGSIHTHVLKRPLVVERERVNFEYEPGYPMPSGDIVTAK